MTPQNKDFLNNGDNTCVVSDRYGCIIVLNRDVLIVCDLLGVRWTLEHHLGCCLKLAVIGSRVVVEQDHAYVATYEYDIHMGTLL